MKFTPFRKQSYSQSEIYKDAVAYLGGIVSNLPMVHYFDCVGHCIFYGIIIIIINPYCTQWGMGPQFSIAWYDKIKGA